MFQSLRPNSQIFIFHKGENPALDAGTIISVSAPRAKYAVPNSFAPNSPEMVVDIVAKVNGLTVNYNNLPANLDLADSYNGPETVTITDNKEAMNSEILNQKQKSIDIVNGFELHKRLIEEYDSMLSHLNPEIAEKQQQKDEINSLKQQVHDMSANIEELMKSNRLLVEQLSKTNKHYENVGNQRE